MSGEKKGDEDCDFSKFAYHLAGRDVRPSSWGLSASCFLNKLFQRCLHQEVKCLTNLLNINPERYQE